MFPPVHISRSLVILPFSACVVRRAITLPCVISWTSLASFGPHTRRPMSECSAFQHTPRHIHATIRTVKARMHWQTAGPNFHQQQDLHRVSHDFQNVVFRVRVCCGMHPFLHGLTQIPFGTSRWRHADGPHLGFSPDSTNPGRAGITRPHTSLKTISTNVFRDAQTERAKSHKHLKKPITAPPMPTDTLNSKCCPVPVKDEQQHG